LRASTFEEVYDVDTSSPQLSWTQNVREDGLDISVNLSVYPLDALFRVCYWFTDRCYLFLTCDESHSVVTVHFAKKTPDTDLAVTAGEFSNELINQKVRRDVADETRGIRELIVAQAFAEADLLDRSESGADYHLDPRGISK
jgi:His-Xaa-Ser system protein HxsD